jgi:hypothetical protein
MHIQSKKKNNTKIKNTLYKLTNKRMTLLSFLHINDTCSNTPTRMQRDYIFNSSLNMNFDTIPTQKRTLDFWSVNLKRRPRNGTIYYSVLKINIK